MASHTRPDIHLHARHRLMGSRSYLQPWQKNPQDYVTPSGRMTTNTVEGFHGLALMYRGKQTDLEHTHYTCKTDMAVCHKVYRQ